MANSGPSAIKYQMPEDPAKIITSSVPPSYSVKIKEAGAPPSSYQGELQCPKISSDDCSLPWNFSRQLNSLKGSNFVLNDIELEVNAMMQDMDVPLGGNPLQFSVDITDSHGNWKPNLSTFSDDMQLDSHYRNSKCSFGDTDISYNIGREDIWDDGNSGDFLDYENGEMPDNAFEGHHMLRKSLAINSEYFLKDNKTAMLSSTTADDVLDVRLTKTQLETLHKILATPTTHGSLAT
ncbi:hypothetical protein GOBAR_DD11323 [Gossypium barbadense]|nr:hypothetical protein GOBAR_DD11323 [Gossypium barbadense]